MLTWALENFTNARLASGEITCGDVRLLQRDVLPNGVTSRDEADVLIALDRAVHEKDPAWATFLVQALVAYVVWTCRPTGRIERETADWLIRSLGNGTGPTSNAIAIAFEIVRECEEADEALVAFVMRWSPRRQAALLASSGNELVF